MFNRRSLLVGSAGLGAGLLGAGLVSTTSHAAIPLASTVDFPIVRTGSNNSNVRFIQARLGASVDGVFGPKTKAAVVSFQRSRGLETDGIVGPKTWSQLLDVVRRGSRGSVVKGLQAKLGGLTRDGVFGPATERAVRSFQSRNNLVVDGIVGVKTWSKLMGGGGGGGGGTGYGNLSSTQLGHVRTIIGVGKGYSIPEYGWVIAIACAMQESTLRNLSGGDRDSVGLFQQRPSQGWGTISQCRTPVLAARAFYGKASHTPNPGLVDISGWQNMSVTRAAQAVQRSGYPDAYAKWESLARECVAKQKGNVGSIR
ncbi:peptidoglycan-binding domain-containing protein [Propionibacteriaceae bacterium Y2011]